MLKRVLAIAGLTVKESARKRVAIGMILCSVVMTLALGLVARSMEATEGSDFGLALAVETLLRVVASFTWVLAVFISITAVPPELDRRTTYTLFAKPVERYEFVLGKFLGCVVLLAVNLCVIGLIVSMLLYRENPQLTRALLLDLATYWVSYTSLIALSISLTLVLPMTVAALLSLGVYFLGAVYGVGLQVAQTEQLHPVWRGLGRLVYGFGRVASPRINWLNTDRPALAVIGHSQAQAVAYVLAYSIVVLLLGAIAFSRREM